MVRNFHTESFTHFYRSQRSWGKVIFSEACVKNSVHRVEHAWQGVCTAGGHAWQGACMAGGHAWRGGCVVGEHATPADTTATAYGQ